MKKLLGFLTLTTLFTTSLSTSDLILNAQSFKISGFNNNLKVTSNPFINKITNIKDKVKIVKTAPDGTIWAGTDKSLWKSIDKAGTDFIQVNKDIFIYEIVDIEFAPNGTIWVQRTASTFKSTDGINFTEIKDVNGIKITITADGTVWIWQGLYKWLYKSIDGVTFTKVAFTNSNEYYMQQLVKKDTSGNLWLVWREYKEETPYHLCKITGDKCVEINSINSRIYDIDFGNDGSVWLAADTGIWKSTDNNNFKNVKSDDTFSSIKVAPNGTVWASGLTTLYKSNGWGFDAISSTRVNAATLKFANDGTVYGANILSFYKSTDSINFEEIHMSNLIQTVPSFDFASDGSIFFGTSKGMYKIDIVNNLIGNFKLPTYYGSLYNGFVYDSEQTINLKEDFLSSAILDGKTVTIPSNDLKIASGSHVLTLTLKSEYTAMSGNKYGKITYNFFIKSNIKPLDINYSTNNNDTDLFNGLVSNLGNTNGSKIIQTKSKDKTIHPANLSFSINDNLIDLKNSYYVLGTVNETNNDFQETRQKVTNLPPEITIKDDGIYHLHLVDVVGNNYDSYLELGENNWKLKGTFDEANFLELSEKLNVTVKVSDPGEKQAAMGWLQNYYSHVIKAFDNSVISNGKGFKITSDIFPNGYKDFLDPVVYTAHSHKEAINQQKLNDTIINLANKKLQEGLSILPSQELNIDTRNVVDNSTLNSYANWINGYQDFIKNNKYQWFSKIIKITSRGFASDDEINKISDYLNKLPLNNYLQHIVWDINKNNIATSNDYLQYIQLDKLQSDVNKYVASTYPDIDQKYQEAILLAQKNINMHGYTLNQLLNGKQLPQTKDEINKYENGQSFHDWLQSEANSKYKSWQLKIGLGVGLGIPILLGIIYLIIHKIWVQPAIRRKRRKEFYNSSKNSQE